MCSVISTDRVLTRAAPATWRGNFIQGGSAISVRVVDPILERCEGPARSASSQMNRRGKSLRRDPTIKCWAAQRRYSKDISKSKKGGRYRRALTYAAIRTRKLAQTLVGDSGHHSTHLPAAPEGCLRKRGRPERNLEQGVCTCRRLPSQ